MRHADFVKMVDNKRTDFIEYVRKLNDAGIQELVYTTPRSQQVIMTAKLDRGGVIKMGMDNVRTVQLNIHGGTLSLRRARTSGKRVLEIVGHVGYLVDVISYLVNNAIPYDHVISQFTGTWMITVHESGCGVKYEPAINYIRKVIDYNVILRYVVEVSPPMYKTLKL